MSTLKEVVVKRAKPVSGFSGVCALVDNFGHQICIVAANEDVLFEQIRLLMPNLLVTGTKFQNVTIIATQDKE